ncbi:vasotab [Drosophila grimshawi]|uniref:vasotab n=1 Tax=Drosophila grimshawi TaxID=7222 RepID=UPI001C93216B|nr:vasotab [Drosophila grimshawi]
MVAGECPSICLAVFSPVCGEARVGGRPIQCTFSNSCTMGVSSCTKGIKWRQIGEGECSRSSARCNSLK